MTKTQQIFDSNCPYDNHSQGSAPRILFVCSAGLLRSPTAAIIANRYGFNARSAGSHLHYALIPVNAPLTRWAHKIVFMNSENYDRTISAFRDDPYSLQRIKEKNLIWNIEDDYNYMDNELVWKIETKLRSSFPDNFTDLREAPKILDESKSKLPPESWLCLDCMASSPYLHKMDCSNAHNNIQKQCREYREMQFRNQYAQTN